MGVLKNVGIDSFPKQGDCLNSRVVVYSHYDMFRPILGTVVRDDTEEPGVMIIRLDNGRYVLASECRHIFRSRFKA